MNRTTSAALIMAGIVGLVGGALFAIVRSDGTSEPIGSRGAALASARLLYATAGTIHDGDREVALSGAPDGVPAELVQLADGYLVAFRAGRRNSDTDLWRVAPDGESERVAEVRGSWDVDAAGERIVGTDAVTGKVSVWESDGSGARTWRSFVRPVYPVFIGEEVLVAPPDGTGSLAQDRWHPVTGQVTREPRSGFTEQKASPDDRLVAGRVATDGYATGKGSDDHCLASRPADSDSVRGRDWGTWRTCDWRSNDRSVQYSPDGKQMMAIPFESDGFGPSVFGIFSAVEGPSDGVTEIATPEATLGAEWLDTEQVLVYGATDTELDDRTGMWIQQCSLEGACKEVVRVEQGRLVVGRAR